MYADGASISAKSTDRIAFGPHQAGNRHNSGKPLAGSVLMPLARFQLQWGFT